MNTAIFLRMGSSGNLPTPAIMLSSKWLGLPVAGITQVTAEWLRMYFRKNCAQDWQSNSAVR